MKNTGNEQFTSRRFQQYTIIYTFGFSLVPEKIPPVSRKFGNFHCFSKGNVVSQAGNTKCRFSQNPAGRFPKEFFCSNQVSSSMSNPLTNFGYKRKNFHLKILPDTVFLPETTPSPAKKMPKTSTD